MTDDVVTTLGAAAIAANAVSLKSAEAARAILITRTPEIIAAYNAAIREARATCHSSIVPWLDDAIARAEAAANEAVAAVNTASRATAVLAAAVSEVACVARCGADFINK